MNENLNRDWMSAQEVAEFLGMTKNYIYILKRRGFLKGHTPFGPHPLLFDKNEVIEAVRTRKLYARS